MTGWPQLVQRFTLQGDFPSEHWRFKSATARYGTHYNSCLTIAASPVGLYLEMLWPFRIGHPPLFIPWNEITVSYARVLLWNVAQFQLGRKDSIVFGFRESFADQIRRAAGSSWPLEAK